MADNKVDGLPSSPLYKSQAWTIRHSYPRTTHNVTYRDWSQDPMRSGHNPYKEPLRSTQCPLPPLKRFRPLPAMDQKEEIKLRHSLIKPQGTRAPPEALHYGYRKFSLDPTTKTLRHFDDPLPHPLHTVARVSYQCPADQPQLKCAQNHLRYGLTPRRVAAGIVPVTICSPPPWSEDCLFDQQQQQKERQEQKRHSQRQRASSQP